MTKKILSIILLLPLVIGLGIYAYNPGVSAQNTEILKNPWHIKADGGASEKYQSVSPTVLSGKSSVQVTYDLHGLCAVNGDASALIFDQNGWKYVALSEYGQNCKDGQQTVTIPLSDFKDITTGQPLDSNAPLTGSLHTRFWYNKPYAVDVTSVMLMGASSSPTPTSSVSSGNFNGLSDGQTVSGKIQVSYTASSTTTKHVDFYIDGNWKWTEHYAPYFLGGDNAGVANGWDTSVLSDGQHTLKVMVTGNDGTSTTDQITFTTKNSAVPTPTGTTNSTSLTPTPTSTASQTTPTPTPIVTTTTNTGGTFAIQSIDVMKDTKDAICGQKDDTYINNIVNKAVELGANYMAISTPYDNPSCGDATAYAKRWIGAIRAHGLHVWHRHMPLSFEGIYSVSKNNNSNYLDMIRSYIKNNPDMFVDGDIFTPIPEPQNGGIQGITYCANSVCQFSNAAAFNQWLRDAMTTSKDAFSVIGKNNIKVGYFGFDGFVAWGDQNPDWHGILEDSTVQQMGNITIDHYPELVKETMDASLTALQSKYPNTPIVIGEWGTVNNTNIDQEVVDTMTAAKNHKVVGFNYWQFGPSGSGEQLLNTDLSNRSSFYKVQSYYRAQ